MEVWEKRSGHWESTKDIDFTDLLAKADPSEIYVTMPDQWFEKTIETKSKKRLGKTIDDLLSTARDFASERAKAKGHTYIVRICSNQFGEDYPKTSGLGVGVWGVPRQVRQFKIQDWDEVL